MGSLPPKGNSLRRIILVLCLFLAIAFSFLGLFSSNKFQQAMFNDWLKLKPYRNNINSKYYLFNFIREKTNSKSVFFISSVNMGEFAYYAERKFVVDTDPKFLPFYDVQNRADAKQFLSNMKIKYILIPPIAYPTWSKSQIKTLIKDASISNLLLASEGYRLFEIKE